MANPVNYAPKVGDRVNAQGNLWEVIAVAPAPCTVTVKLVGREEHVVKFPCGAVTPVNKAPVDVNQAAARIVREATEN
jgi:hypothetical protein